MIIWIQTLFFKYTTFDILISTCASQDIHKTIPNYLDFINTSINSGVGLVVFNFVVVTAGSVLLVEQAWLDERWATLVMTVLAIPVTFLLTRHVLTTRRGDTGG